MTVLSIRERIDGTELPGVVIDDDVFLLPRGLASPFSQEDDALLEWYFEEFLEFPVIREIDARRSAESITRYGEALFEQVFANPDAYRRYQEVSLSGGALAVEVVGSPDFQSLHWEALKDPRLPRPLAVDGRLVRRPSRPPTEGAGAGHRGQGPRVAGPHLSSVGEGRRGAAPVGTGGGASLEGNRHEE